MKDAAEKEAPPRGGLSRLERVLMGTAMAIGAACVVLTLIGTRDSVAAITGLLGT